MKKPLTKIIYQNTIIAFILVPIVSFVIYRQFELIKLLFDINISILIFTFSDMIFQHFKYKEKVDDKS